MPFDPADPTIVRDLSWTGDALLTLFAREWIMAHEAELGTPRAELFRDLTSNAFLSTLGPPSVIEARLGDAYRSGGLAAAQAYFDSVLLPLFQRQHAKRRRQQHR